MDKKGYFKEGGEEYENKYGAENPYYGGVQHETKDGDTVKEDNTANDFWAKTDKKEYSASIDGPGVMIEKEDVVMDDMEDITPKPSYPTQEDIIQYNRMQEAVRVRIEDKENETVTVKKSFLEKLKDFEYWKEWKHRGD